jgi:hypothetical protein
MQRIVNRTGVFAAAAAVAALIAVPASALPGQVPANQGTAHGPSGAPYGAVSNPGSTHRSSKASDSQPNTPGPNASLPAKAKAYGVYCQKESKKHVAGQKGTPFSQCVTAMAKLAHGSTKSPVAACATLSKKHIAGQKGTPFSQCVSAAAKLKNDS